MILFGIGPMVISVVSAISIEDMLAGGPTAAPGMAGYATTTLFQSQSQGSIGAELGGGSQVTQVGGQDNGVISPMYHQQAATPYPYQTTPSPFAYGGAGGQYGGGVTGKPAVSEESKQIVSGLVEAFMHKVHLLPGEKTCLENSVAQLAADVTGTVSDVVIAIKALLGGRPAQPGGGSPMSSKGSSSMVSAGIDGAMKITSLVTLATTLVKNCVQGDALALLNSTAKRLINLKYLGHRMIVSGVDIAHCLSDCIIAYQQHQYERFGRDLGTALRKILLSNSTQGAKLPEGMPEEEIIQKTSEGLFKGFFVGNSSMEVTDLGNADVDIHLDLHRCIAGNSEFFKEVFMAIWNAIAMLSINAEQHGLQTSVTPNATYGVPGPAPAMPGALGATGPGAPKWTGELMIALMQLPMALERCGVDENTQSMLMEAIQNLGQLRIHINFPADRLRMKEIEMRMAKAVEAWTTWDFTEFGREIGVMLREFVLLMYPMQYSVDKRGRLRRQLYSSSIKPGQSLTPSHFTFILGGVACSVLVGLLAVRGIRSASTYSARDENESGSFLDVEQVE